MSAWAEIGLSIPRDLVAQVESVLQQQGALAITLLDHADEPVLEPAPGEAPLWSFVQVRGLFPATVTRPEVSHALFSLPGLDRPDTLCWRDVADQDWERAWMDQFHSMQFGHSLWIVPTGMEAPEDKQAIVLKLDPGLAFGTGTHATTALCLQWIDGQNLTGSKVVDYGCGSGVLGIACALKGAYFVNCVDNDPQALQATHDNAVRNGVLERISCLNPETFQSDQNDVVLANILAQPLITLAPVLMGSLRSGGHIVLSGLLQEQTTMVAERYQGYCSDMKISLQDGWACIHGLAR